MAQSIIDNGLLKAVKIWLEPLRDKSLPALDIQNSFFDILVKVRRLNPSIYPETYTLTSRYPRCPSTQTR
jgi:transcription factor SPN1